MIDKKKVLKFILCVTAGLALGALAVPGLALLLYSGLGVTVLAAHVTNFIIMGAMTGAMGGFFHYDNKFNNGKVTNWLTNWLFFRDRDRDDGKDGCMVDESVSDSDNRTTIKPLANAIENRGNSGNGRKRRNGIPTEKNNDGFEHGD